MVLITFFSVFCHVVNHGSFLVDFTEVAICIGLPASLLTSATELMGRPRLYL